MQIHLAEVRKEKNISQKELAEILGISFSSVSKYEHGKIRLSLQRIEEIAKALNVSIDKIVEKENTDNLCSYDTKTKYEIFYNNTQCLSKNEMSFKDYIVEQAEGNCELCGNRAPYIDKNGKPRLFVFKVKFENSNPFDPKEYVTLCPNCADELTFMGTNDDILYLQDVAKNHKYKILKEEVE